MPSGTRPRSRPVVGVIIPALNEEASIGKVLAAIPEGWVDRVIVVDNGSTDRTAEIARSWGATVVREPQRGYGSACLAGIAALPPEVEIVVFLDADFSDDPSELPRLLEPILRGEADLVIGSRVLGRREPGALAPQARWGNWLATRLIRLRWGVSFTDLGPFRAVRRETLNRLQMQDRTYGWTVEMQAKAAALRVPCREVPVSYRRRIGKSKITGTVKGTLLAGVKILGTIGYYWIRGISAVKRPSAEEPER
ncbi:MAG: glycosyl hydrolase [Candidatus Poribacteria bacterium]|nr:MAG: glycosyl hydrolase [Candidatus Poribacteria bacterium]